MLKKFSSAIKKTESFCGVIKDKVGIGGISRIAKDTAETYVNTIVE